MKERIAGLVQNISTNPFQTFAKHKSRNSTVFSFDISFDIIDDEGGTRHVWFKRSFRLPPKLEDGDQIDIVGRQGYLLGLFGRHNFYALRIIDKKRKREYTPWRNIYKNDKPEKSRRASKSPAPGRENVA
jgi:hypothetical protein